MYGIRRRTFLVALAVVVALVLLAPTIARADISIIPWMTGGFYGWDWGFSMGAPSYDGQWVFGFDASPEYSMPTLTWECDEYLCYGQGWSSIDGGGVGGYLWRWDGSNYLYEAGYTGVVTGGSVYGQEWISAGEDHRWTQFSFDFTGTWTNGWHTDGNVYASWSSDSNPYSQWALFTYATPEPSTLLTLASGGLGLAGFVRRKTML